VCLPLSPSGRPWSPNIYYAFEIISQTYKAAANVLQIEAPASQLKFHAHGLTENIVPILIALKAQAAEESFPLPWVHDCARAAAQLVKKLCDAQTIALDR
jgi:hypothetical protein